MIRVVALPPLLAGALGALGGWVWWQWWGPPPDGRVYDTRDGRQWFPTPFDPGVARDFGGTATYVVLGLGLALVLGLVAGVAARRRPIVGLVAVGLASAVAAVVMTLVGQAQSPPDPQELVDDVEVGATLPGHLHVSGWTPYLVWPVGALIGYTVVMLGVGGRWEPSEQPSAAPEHRA